MSSISPLIFGRSTIKNFGDDVSWLCASTNRHREHLIMSFCKTSTCGRAIEEATMVGEFSVVTMHDDVAGSGLCCEAAGHMRDDISDPF